MRTSIGARQDRLARLFRRNVQALESAGLVRLRVEVDPADGGVVVIDDRSHTNFGLCTYMGLNTDQRLKDAAMAAIAEYGPVYSSSAAYTSVSAYSELEELLDQIFTGPTLVVPTTTLAHMAFFQVAFRPGDHIVVDAEAHASIHHSLAQVVASGIPVTTVAHNDEQELAGIVAAAAASSDRVWYLADGVYSMRGDEAPWATVNRLLAEHPKLHVYVDDAHGFSWFGRNGRGLAAEHLDRSDRVNIAVSLAKSFGSGGAALSIPDDELRDTVRIASGPMTFSGPLHPAQIGAAVASARIHLSPEQSQRSAALTEHLDVVLKLAHELGLPLASRVRTPIWFVPVGSVDRVVELGKGLMADGFYANVSVFPAVPHGKGGIRFANTLHHSLCDVESFMSALARRYHRIPRSAGA